MSVITYLDKVKFETIENEVLEVLKDAGYMQFSTSYQILCGMVETAKRQNKLNNSLLQSGDNESHVMTFEAKDMETGELVKRGLKPSKANTVKQLFIYEVLKSQYATLEMYKHFKK